MRTFSQRDRQLQGTPGAIAVPHAKTRWLDYHPHVHLVMPAAAVDGARRRRHTKRPGKGKGVYLFNHRALAWVKQRAPIICTCCKAGVSINAERLVQALSTQARVFCYLSHPFRTCHVA